ncbi:zinc finger protein 431-like [Teleopsis dalmanni]|uniref:zinc finger protein 431-like n=1 Tax=Teleopsis dalmanni TaxID=139649 RepID=UPI000D32A6C2|nr:zinc finger protein 431-like [Teleopsis dalmanni]XP_037955143.1 zinc finger protein 431-like [Teleopsis dalmanni]XP_037955144.1 zinc finger protein 431-like [Teleopsis dalmanni]
MEQLEDDPVILDESQCYLVLKCFVCDHAFDEGEESLFLFNCRVEEKSQIEYSVSTILSNILGFHINESDTHSRFLCTSCYDDLLNHDRLEQQLFELRNSIIRMYNVTAKRLGLAIVPTDLNDALEMPSANEILLDIGLEQKRDTKPNFANLNHKFEGSINQATNTELPEAQQLFIKEEPQRFFSEIRGENLQNKKETQLILPDSLNLHYAINIPVGLVDESIDDLIVYDNSSDQTSLISSALNYNQNNESNTCLPDYVDNCKDDLVVVVDMDQNHEHEHTVKTLLVSEGNSKHELKYERNSNNYCCLTCNVAEEFDAESFVEHMLSVHSIHFFICDICNVGFTNNQDLHQHLEEHYKKLSNGAQLECNVCTKKFENPRQYRIHKRMHGSFGKVHECVECHKQFNSKKVLDEHMNIHTGLRPFKCNLCPKDFASKYTLQTHVKIHSERLRPFECDECDKTFMHHQNLVQHKKLHTNTKDFVCDICNKAFFTKHNMEFHKVIHTSNRPYNCTTCEKSFARRNELRDHERIHTGEKPFKCDICSTSFAQRSNLMSHKKSTHFNEKTHECEICHRSFKRRRLLDYHKKAAHTGERPYKCDMCGSGFVYPEHFKKHMRIHSGEKPYECEVCGKRFSSSDNRNAHRFVHSNKKPYECMECGAGFMRKPFLLAHLKQTQHISETIIVNQPQIQGTSYLELFDNLVESAVDPLDELIEHVKEEYDEIDVQDTNI